MHHDVLYICARDCLCLRACVCLRMIAYACVHACAWYDVQTLPEPRKPVIRVTGTFLPLFLSPSAIRCCCFSVLIIKKTISACSSRRFVVRTRGMNNTSPPKVHQITQITPIRIMQYAARWCVLSTLQAKSRNCAAPLRITHTSRAYAQKEMTQHPTYQHAYVQAKSRNCTTAAHTAIEHKKMLHLNAL